jgi:lactobin A/cerein 7B family class IIb bacteriocin
MLIKYLTDKKDEGFALLDLEATEAVAKINADGYDFTVEELQEFTNLLENASTSDELDENALDDVAGGVIPVIGPAIGILVVAAYGAYKASKKKCR